MLHLESSANFCAPLTICTSLPHLFIIISTCNIRQARQHLPTLLRILDTSKFVPAAVTEFDTRGRSHSNEVNIVSCIERTVKVGSLTVAALVVPVVDSRSGLDRCWASRVGRKRFADNLAELSGELLCQEKVGSNTVCCNTTSDVVHPSAVAKDALGIAIALGGKGLNTGDLSTIRQTSFEAVNLDIS